MQRNRQYPSMNNMEIDDLARITQEQFVAVDEQLNQLRVGQQKLEVGVQRLESGLQKVLDVVLEIPSKKVFEKIVDKVEDHEDRIGTVERKLRTVSP